SGPAGSGSAAAATAGSTASATVGSTAGAATGAAAGATAGAARPCPAGGRSARSTAARHPARSRLRLPQHVALTAHRVDQARRPAALRLLAQTGDVGLHDVDVAVEVPAPHPVEDQ